MKHSGNVLGSSEEGAGGRIWDCCAEGGFPELRPEGPTVNSHAREGVVTLVLIYLEAQRAGTLSHAMSSIIVLCRTFGTHSS
jgi:hypothetical protein